MEMEIKFDLQRFSDDSYFQALDSAMEGGSHQQPQQTQEEPPAQETSPQEEQQESTPPVEEPTGGDDPGAKTFTQDEVNQIIERRLRRERRAFERRLREMEQKVQPPPQQQQPPQQPDPMQARQFIQEFSRNPQAALRKFAERYSQEEQARVMEAQRRAASAASEALDTLRDRYEDFDQHSQEVLRVVQSSPALSNILRRFGADITPEIYEDVLDQAYQMVSRFRAQQATKAAQAQVAQEQRNLAQQKQRAGGSPQKAASPSPQSSDPGEVLFQAMQNVGRRI